MLRLLILLLLSNISSVVGQKTAAGATDQQGALSTASLLTSSGSVTAMHRADMQYVESYDLDLQSLPVLQSHTQAEHWLSITFRGQIFDLELTPQYLKTGNYQTRNTRSTVQGHGRAYYYSGSLKGQDGWATLAVIGDEIRVLIAHADGNIEIIKKNGYYIGYEHHDRKAPMHYACQQMDAGSVSIKNTKGAELRQGVADCLELSISCDYDSYLANGSSIANTEAWALSIINDVATIYSNEGIELVVTETIVWDTPDPYASSTNKTQLRDAFVSDVQGTYVGRAAYLFSTRDLDGGLAYGIGGFCAEYPTFPGPYAVATTLSATIDPYPAYSFNTQVVAHELGHVLGARHTHACVWSSGEQIDDCGNVWADTNGLTPEGTGCYDVEQPILPASGTIMSYCDLVAGVGINLANGMGAEVGTFLLDTYNAATCSTGGLCATIPPSNDPCAEAIELPLRPYCIYDRYDNILATPSLPSTISCAGAAGDDVWFSVTAQSAGIVLTIAPVSGGIGGIVAVAYEGVCGSLSEIACNSSATSSVSLPLSGLIVGQTYYIRVQSLSGTDAGAFDICARDPSSLCHPYEDVLTSLYTATNGAQWVNNDGWGTSISPSNCEVCTWYGIVCDNQENIIEIDLSFNNLVGTLPASIGEIVTLQKLNLFSNSLTDNIPDVFESQVSLEFIDLSANAFSGLIPRSILDLPALHTVYLENNTLQDTLPMELGLIPNLAVLWLKNNQITGCFPGTFVNLCSASSTSFTGNAGLPGGGDFIAYCLDGTGNDEDMDGYCKGTGTDVDCDDQDDTVYPAAPELCDAKDNDCNGEIDDGVVLTNTWMGGSTGSWNTAANWSTGGVPRACEDVVISASANTITLSAGVGYCRSLTMLGSSTLVLQDELSVAGSDEYGVYIGTGSTIENEQILTIEQVAEHGIIVEGVLSNIGQIFVANIGSDAEIFVGAGLVENEGGTINLQE